MKKVVLSVLLLWGVASAQYYPTFDPSVNDARARAMGYTEILNNNGPSSAAVNPANLVYVDKLSAEVSGKLSWGNGREFGNDYHYKPYLKLSTIAVARPFSFKGTKFTAGLIYNSYFDYGTKASTDSYYNDIETGVETQCSGGLNTLGVAVAGTIFNKLHLGIGLHRSFLSSAKLKTDYSYSAYPGDYVDDYYEDTAKTQSYFVTIGQVFELSDKWTFGLMYRSDMRLKYRDEKVKTKLTNGDSYDDDTYNQDWNIPSYVGIAINYRPNPEFVVSAEYQNRPFSGVRVIGLDFITNLDYTGYKMQFSGACYRLGMEIDKTVDFRFGIFADNIYNAYYSNTDYPGLNIGGTFGVGCNWKNYTCDFYAEYSTVRPNYSDNENEDWYGIGLNFGYSIDI
jgi:hypothetical protein